MPMSLVDKRAAFSHNRTIIRSALLRAATRHAQRVRVRFGEEKEMDANLIFGLVGLVGLFAIYYLIGKVLIALSNTWVGDLLIGDARPSWLRRQMKIEDRYWNDAAAGNPLSPYYHHLNDD